MAKNVIIGNAYQDIQYLDSGDNMVNQGGGIITNKISTFPTSTSNAIGIYCPEYTGSSTNISQFPISSSNKTFRIGNKCEIFDDGYGWNTRVQTIMLEITLPEGCGDFEVTPYFHNITGPSNIIKIWSTFGIISINTSISASTLQAACNDSNQALIYEGSAGYDNGYGSIGEAQASLSNFGITSDITYETTGATLTSTTAPSFTTGKKSITSGKYILYYSIFANNTENTNIYPSWSITCTGDPDFDDSGFEVTEFKVASSNINQWAPVETSVVGGIVKYGICVTNTAFPRYTFLDPGFRPESINGSLSIIELYANSEGQGDPNINPVFDGVALTNVGEANIPEGTLDSNTAVYGIAGRTKYAKYVYSFADNGYANTKKMAVGGDKNRSVFVIRSWGTVNVNQNFPYIAFIGDDDVLQYDEIDLGYSVGCAGATKTAYTNTWVMHTAGDGTKYYAITNTTNNLNNYITIPLISGHTYRFTLHAYSEVGCDGVAICNNINTIPFDELVDSDLLSGSIATGKCSGEDATAIFEYTETGENAGVSVDRYIYFKSDGSNLGVDIGDTQEYFDDKSFADVMVVDLGDHWEEQPRMYFKKAGSWTPVKEIYKKVNGAWVKQITSVSIGNVFSSDKKYLGRYLDGSTWKNLIDK